MHTENVKPIRALLIHGMGRTPLSMLILAARLRAAGIRPVLFGYSATFESWLSCTERLRAFMERRLRGDRFIIVGHSLGSVLARAVIPSLSAGPAACFFIAPPTRACLVARTLAPFRLYGLLTGEMGRLLALPDFMDSLPQPAIPTKIYAGTGGPRGRWSPFGAKPNDGLLTVAETHLPSVPVLTVRSLHTFIMNSGAVARDIVQTTRMITSDRVTGGR